MTRPKRQLCAYTLRFCANDMAAKARNHASLGRLHAPMAWERAFHNGAVSALEHEVRAMRFLARRLVKEAKRLEKARVK